MKRIRVRNISWKDYGISVQTQRELKEFCFLYDEKKKRGNSQDLTDCKMIEEAARESSEELAPYLLKSVTDDLSYEYLIRWDVFRLERQIFMDTEENSMRVC